VEKIIKQLGIFLTVVGVSIYTLLLPRYAYSQYYSQGDVNKSVSIDKKIRPINSDKSVDNIDKDEKLFTEGDSLDFSLLVENTGNQELLDLKVTDYLPAYQNIVFNPGNYGKENSNINWVIDRLGVGESKVFTIRTKIGAVKIDYSQMITNKACVNSNGLSDCDWASFFVTGKSVPSTGSEGILIQSAMALSGAVLALGLRKKTRGY
jgi:uncharacterized repeat protein (TIGR01451 family)